jgi:hypothetical protein
VPDVCSGVLENDAPAGRFEAVSDVTGLASGSEAVTVNSIAVVSAPETAVGATTAGGRSTFVMTIDVAL